MDPSQLEDIAILYVALAKGADNQFHYRELEAIRSRLAALPGLSTADSLFDMLESILDRFSEDGHDSEHEVEQALVRLNDELSQELKRSILRDLSQIGLADRKFLHAEAAFIHRVSKKWDLPPLRGLSDSWSILGEGGIRGEGAQALATMYLLIAHAPDRDISDAEMEAMKKQLGQWLPGATEDELDLALRDALARYATSDPETAMETAAATVRRLIPAHQHPVIFQDLKVIATADRVMQIEERSWLKKLENALGLAG